MKKQTRTVIFQYIILLFGVWVLMFIVGNILHYNDRELCKTSRGHNLFLILPCLFPEPFNPDESACTEEMLCKFEDVGFSESQELSMWVVPNTKEVWDKYPNLGWSDCNGEEKEVCIGWRPLTAQEKEERYCNENPNDADRCFCINYSSEEIKEPYITIVPIPIGYDGTVGGNWFDGGMYERAFSYDECEIEELEYKGHFPEDCLLFRVYGDNPEQCQHEEEKLIPRYNNEGRIEEIEKVKELKDTCRKRNVTVIFYDEAKEPTCIEASSRPVLTDYHLSSNDTVILYHTSDDNTPNEVNKNDKLRAVIAIEDINHNFKDFPPWAKSCAVDYYLGQGFEGWERYGFAYTDGSLFNDYGEIIDCDRYK